MVIVWWFYGILMELNGDLMVILWWFYGDFILWDLMGFYGILMGFNGIYDIWMIIIRV